MNHMIEVSGTRLLTLIGLVTVAGAGLGVICVMVGVFIRAVGLHETETEYALRMSANEHKVPE